MIRDNNEKQGFKFLLTSIVCTIIFISTIIGGVLVNQTNVSATGGKIVIHYYTEEWEKPNIYYWNSLPKNKEVKWPGVAMKAEDTNNWYTYTFEDTSKINFLFNYNGKQSDDYSEKTGEYWYKNGKRYTKNPDGTSSGGETTVIDPDETALTARTDFRDETIYFLMTTRFYDGCTSNNARTSGDDQAGNPSDDPSWRGDFAGLIEKLDYIKALGFTAVWITPVVENSSAYDFHGYHSSNYSKVDPRYESEGAGFQDVINAVHSKGMKIVQDVVFNHVSINGEAYLGQRGNENYHNMGCVGNWEGFPVQTGTIDGNDGDCQDLNTENPNVSNYIVNAYSQYINMGVDAFRVDTVKHISRLTFNKAILPGLLENAKKAGNDKFYMFGECCTRVSELLNHNMPCISCCFYTWNEDEDFAWGGDTATNFASTKEHFDKYSTTNNFKKNSNNAFLNGLDYHTPDYSEYSGLSVIDFPMHWNFQNAKSAFDKAQQREVGSDNEKQPNDSFYNDATWNVVYVDSHDYGPNSDTRYGEGTDAWAENLDLMFTFRGIPCLYYGSEIEFQKGMPCDKGPTAPLSTTGRAYYGDNIEGDVTATDFGEYTASGTVSQTLAKPLAQHVINVNKIRSKIPALRKGQYTEDNKYVNGNMAFIRRYTDKDSKVDNFVCVTISGDATFTNIPNGEYIDACTGDIQKVTDGTLKASCSGKGNMRVYVLNNGSGINGKIANDDNWFK